MANASLSNSGAVQLKSGWQGRHTYCILARVHYQALALDYDGTLATDGTVPARVVEALRRVRSSGRRLVMVTGRELADLKMTFAHVDLFDRVVAENGGLLYTPETGAELPLAVAPSSAFVEALRDRGVRVSVGAVIVATWETDWPAVRAVMAHSGLKLDVVLNKGAVMILPAGVNKGTGLAMAAAELGLEPRSIVGMGDGENDHSLLRACGLGIAVANAVPALKEQADEVTASARGEGVIEVIEKLLADDLAGMTPRPREEVAVAVNDAEAREG